ncbi:MAG: CapA family protein [Oscillospiraceae bacterium]|nr:CapA family protein [Oscillospiraceae bacterium]
MANYQNDPARRKQARYAKKAKQRRRNRRLVLAVLVLALAAGWFFLNSGEEPGETTPLPVQTTAPAETSPAGTEPPKPQTGTTVIHIAAAGDLNVTDYVLENAAHENGYDFSQAFLDVGPILSAADLTLLNFEGNLSGGSYGYATGAAPLELPKALKSIGVDAVQTANSAAIRQGVSGLVSTLEAFEHVGLPALGTYANSEDFQRRGGYDIVEVEGIRIALVAFTKGMDNLGLPAGSEDCVNILYKDYSSDYKQVDTDRIARVLRNVNEEQPDLTIAMVHWGSEYNDEISKSQDKIRKQLQEGGVDIILGTHPHVLQRVDYDPIAKTLVAWSLGDFFGDGAMAGTNYSVILDLEITRDNATGEVFLSNWDYIPIFTLKPEQSVIGGHRVVRIREAMERYEAEFVGRITEETYSTMEKALDRIDERVNPKPDSEE